MIFSDPSIKKNIILNDYNKKNAGGSIGEFLLWKKSIDVAETVERGFLIAVFFNMNQVPFP